MKKFICPFMQGKPCIKDDCALYYGDNDTCSIYQIALNAENIADNLVSALLNHNAVTVKTEGEHDSAP